MKCIECGYITENKLFCSLRCETNFMRILKTIPAKQQRLFIQFLDNPNDFILHKTYVKIKITPKFNPEYLYSNKKDVEKIRTPKYKRLWLNTFKKQNPARNLLEGSKGRFKIFKRDHFTCQYCGATVEGGAKLAIDHVYPIDKGGGDDLHNLITCCESCNLIKQKTLLPKEMIMKFWIDAEYRNNIELDDKEYYELQTEMNRYFESRRKITA